MSCAGIWGRTSPLAQPRAMLASFCDDGRDVATYEDATAELAMGEACWGDIDVSPMRAHPSGVAVAGDMRLHERAVLAELLGCPDRQDEARWLVAEAYLRYGTSFPQLILGDFAIALWDPRMRRLLLTRDTGGVCPLFYSTRCGRVAFASHPRGLLTLPGFPQELDERAIVDYLTELPQHEPATLFAAVRRLPPGHTLVVTEAGERAESYFDIESVPELKLARDEDYAAALRETMREAVACRLPRGPAAVMLSGGLDSSSITMLAAGQRRQPALLSVSAIFPEHAECDERNYQAAVVVAAGTDHHQLSPNPLGSAGDFARLCGVFSEPSFIGPHWLAWDAAALAVRHGASAMFTGIDGDRVVSHGAGRFGDLAAARDWGGLARELLAVEDFGWGRRLRVGSVQALLALLPPSLSVWLERADPRRVRRLTGTLALLRPTIARRHGLAARVRELPIRARSTRAEHARILQTADRNWDVELLDQLGGALGLRFEQPFFDRRVVRLCFSLPGSQKRQAGWSRFVLRRAMRGLVPRLVLERKHDASFDRPYWCWARAWLGQHAGPLDGLANISEYVDVAKVQGWLRDLPPSPDSGPVDFLWRCVILSRWLERAGTFASR